LHPKSTCGRRFLAVGLLLALLPSGAIASPWLVVSDVHYSPFARRAAPSPEGKDTNETLLRELFREMRAVDPNPPVVIMPGDFLAHGFPGRAAAQTMARLAERFNDVFPHSQFVIALGNGDSACGDYEAPLDGGFLRVVARAWAPLVNRRGASPRFIATFSHDGSYVASLPLPHLRAVVVNDVSASVRYGARCAGRTNAAAALLTRLRAVLRAGQPGEHSWLVFHIPPGFDAFSTAHLAHGLVAIPFMRPGARSELLRIIDDPQNRVTLVVAGHTHKFSFRISGTEPFRVPMLLAPSVSPIFGNAPSFLTLDVEPDGTISDATEISYRDRHWSTIGDLRSFGARAFTVDELLELQERLARDTGLRERFALLYNGGLPGEITERNWRSYWCAATNFTETAFRSCAPRSGTALILVAVGTVVTLAAIAVLLSAVFFRRRRT